MREAPILFLVRGHSGSSGLSRLLIEAGVYLGDMEDPKSLNKTYDSLIWTYKFQRKILPSIFEYGKGIVLAEDDLNFIKTLAKKLVEEHLLKSNQKKWGFKTGAGMFMYPVYKILFPKAKFIYLIRDGRDVILSNKGFFHLTNPPSRNEYWEYFKIITFGISNDIEKTPFPFPQVPSENDPVMQNKYWIQAKSWIEHIKMMEFLEKKGIINWENILTVKYEDLCFEPQKTAKKIFDFLQLEVDDKVLSFAENFFYTDSVGKWKDYEKHIYKSNENIEEIFDFMKPYLNKLEYI